MAGTTALGAALQYNPLTLKYLCTTDSTWNPLQSVSINCFATLFRINPVITLDSISVKNCRAASADRHSG